MTLEVVTAKYKTIRTSIERDIRRGRYGPCERLPNERDLAQLFGVSYMTARRAITDLVEADMLERRAGAGVFVRSLSSSQLTKRRVNVICPADDTGSTSRRFQDLASRQCEAHGWRPHIVHFQQDYYRSAHQAILGGDPAIALLGESVVKGALNTALRQASDRLILVGSRMTDNSLPSIMADDSLGVRMAVDHLKAAGHKRIGLMSYFSKLSIAQTLIHGWRTCFPEVPEDELHNRHIVIHLPRHVSISDQAYNVTREYFRQQLKRRDEAITALVIYLSDDLVHAALAACRDSHRDVPAKLSVICYGSSSELAYAYPPVTFVDNNLERHLEVAVEMLTSLLDGTLSEEDRIQTIRPFLVERQSVAPPY